MKRFALLLAVLAGMTSKASAAPGDDLTVKEAELAQLESDISSAASPTDPTAAMWRSHAISATKYLRRLIDDKRHAERAGGYYNPYFRIDSVPFGGPYTHAVVVDPIHNLLCRGRQHLVASLVAYPYRQATWSNLGTPAGYFKVLVPLP